MNAVVKTESLPVAAPADHGGLLAAIARAAADPTVDVDKMEKLFAMHQAMVERDAKQQYVEAMTAFKMNPPDIIKRKDVAFGQTKYKHATLDMVSSQITEGLSRHGITHRWLTEQIEGGKIRVTCILTHRAGHSESTALESAADNSGGKNAIQGIGSAVTYLQRYTLLAATGLATRDMTDDDGRGGDRDEPRITQEQADELQALIEANGRDLVKFKKWMKVEKLTDIYARSYQTAIDAVKVRSR